jgi:hypothetical protein
LNAHVRDAAPDSARKTVPGLCLAVETFRPPTMPLIQPSILVAPSVTASSSPEQSGIVVANHDCFVRTPFRQAVAPYWTARAIFGLGIEEATVLHRPSGAQNAPSRAFQDVVLGIIAKAVHGHTRSDRLGLCRDQCVDAAPLESTVDLRVSVAGIGRYGFNVDPCSCFYLIHLGR